jgi:hypothetical protein
MKPLVLQAIKGKTSRFDVLKEHTGRLIVWWYGGITKNQRDQTVPLVAVFFRWIIKSGQPGAFLRKDVALTHLGLLRVGDVVENGVCTARAVRAVETFDVDFTEGAWGIVSAGEAWRAMQPNPIDQDDYELQYRRDKSWLIDFPLGDGKNLLVPCLEYFMRCYGHSVEVKRVLATYLWPDVKRRFYIPLEKPADPLSWPVRLTRRMRNGDVVLLAHLLYDEYARSQARQINGQLMVDYQNPPLPGEKRSYVFVKVHPWFQGAAQLKVNGLWINGGKTFLALNILGSSDPQGVPIQRDRENSNLVDTPAPEGDQGKAWAGAPRRTIKSPPEIIDLTDADAPDHEASIIDIEEDEFVVLGTPRTVIDVRRAQAKSSSGKPGDGGNPDTFSTGEAYGSGKCVGYASVHAPQVLESHGVLRDMWNAMLYVKSAHPDLIQKVEWFTFDRGFCEEAEPQLVSLAPQENDKPVDGNWFYFNVKEEIPRGVMVARLSIGQKHVYILEIQRRSRAGGNDEESFKGFVFALEDDGRFDSCLRSLLSSVRSVKGIVKKLEGRCPGDSGAFKHVSSHHEKVPCEAAVWNALGKVGIKP